MTQPVLPLVIIIPVDRPTELRRRRIGHSGTHPARHRAGLRSQPPYKSRKDKD
jgi:hypothetical protein